MVLLSKNSEGEKGLLGDYFAALIDFLLADFRAAFRNVHPAPFYISYFCLSDFVVEKNVPKKNCKLCRKIWAPGELFWERESFPLLQ